MAILDPDARVEFLGFPDGGLEPLWRLRPGDPPYVSAYTGAGPFARDDVRAALASALAAARPTLVVGPDPDDRHPDHAALGRFVAEATADLAPAPLVLTYVVHADTWPPASGLDRPMPPPDDPPFPERRWTSFALTPAEVAVERRALAEYHSQWPILGGLLERFVRPTEVFALPPR
jgi:LmbE family N-acetylglucosaminyl deacetylase